MISPRAWQVFAIVNVLRHLQLSEAAKSTSSKALQATPAPLVVPPSQVCTSTMLSLEDYTDITCFQGDGNDGPVSCSDPFNRNITLSCGLPVFDGFDIRCIAAMAVFGFTKLTSVQWSSFFLRIGSPPQTVRVLLSTASNQPLMVLPDGCSSDGPSDCANRRGGLFQRNSSSTW